MQYADRSMSIKDPFAAVARSVGSPFRNFFNSHFEMTKEEIRRSTEHLAKSGEVQQDTNIAELANVVAETQLHQARIIGELRREVADLRRQVDEMTTATRETTAVLAASTLVPDASDPTSA